jgi:uncharacterized protein YndB with AHSA1/START domain
MSDAGEIIDRIEREVTIPAPLERVWRLVSEPGWWIGDGDPASPRVVTREGDVVVVDYPPHGRFPVLPVSTDAPHYVSYRSGDDPSQVLAEGNSTLVEFFLTEHNGGRLLWVVESGFAALYPSAERHAAVVQDNIGGWELMLGVAKRDAEREAA